MVYKRKYSYAVEAYKVSAEVVGETMEKIEARDGEVTNESFLEESRPEEAPTHVLFEWNDEVAAEKYRLHQSKTIINNLRIEIVTDEAEPKTVKAYINTAESQHQKARYINFENAICDDRTKGIMYRNALAELAAFKRKYKELKELDALFTEIDKVVASA